MTQEKVCATCGYELNEDNTKDYGGFDQSNYEIVSAIARVERHNFEVCDNCLEARIDQYENN